MSTPSTRPAAPTAAAAANETSPVPQATSRTRSPARSATRASMLGLRQAELRLPEALVVVRRQVPAVALDAPLQPRFHVSAG